MKDGLGKIIYLIRFCFVDDSIELTLLNNIRLENSLWVFVFGLSSIFRYRLNGLPELEQKKHTKTK